MAKLAGVPDEVVKRAGKILASIDEHAPVDPKKNLLPKTDGGIAELVKPLLYNAGIPDNFAVLTLYPLYSSDNPAPEQPVKDEEIPETVRKSKKGKGIIALTVLICVVLLPIILLWLLFGFISNRIRFSKELKRDEP